MNHLDSHQMNGQKSDHEVFHQHNQVFPLAHDHMVIISKPVYLPFNITKYSKEEEQE